MMISFSDATTRLGLILPFKILTEQRMQFVLLNANVAINITLLVCNIQLVSPFKVVWTSSVVRWQYDCTASDGLRCFFFGCTDEYQCKNTLNINHSRVTSKKTGQYQPFQGQL